MKQLTMLNSEDTALVNGIFNGEKICEERLVSKFRGRLKSYLVQYLGDMARAEDLAHETLLIVLQKLRNEIIAEPSKLTAYVFSTAKYVYIGWRRKKANQVELRDSMDDLVSERVDMEQVLMHGERRRHLHESIDQLSTRRDRDILSRCYILEQSKNEICAALTISPTHYDRVIYRAKTRLRSNMVRDCAIQGQMQA